MKSIILLFTLSLSLYTFGQDSHSSNEDIPYVDTPVLESDFHNVNDTKTSINNNNSTLFDIKSEYWETEIFNPYNDVELKFPIRLDFSDSSYAAPMTGHKIVTSHYGWRKGRAHQGIDIDLVTGDSVFAMLEGIVRFVNYNSGHGKTVVVRHFNGLETVYAHLSKYAVKVNDTVSRGQLLGNGGTTGNARGSHLHLRVNYKGVAINPEYLFDFNDENKIRSPEIWVTKSWTTPYFHSSKNQSKLELLASEEQAIESLKKEKTIYIVKRGDTLSGISNKNSISIKAICELNKIKKTSVLKIGQKLILEL